MFGLFKGKKEIATQDVVVAAPKPFEKITITTQNLGKDLSSLAEKHQVSVKKLDFKILAYKTFYKLSYGEIFQEVTPLNKDDIFTKENFLKSDMGLYQELKVEVFLKDKSSKFPISMAIGGNKALTKIQVQVKPQSDVQYFDGLESEIMAELDRKKAKLGILLGVMDGSVKKGVHKVVSAIRVNSAIEEGILFTACEGFDVRNEGSSEVLYHYRYNEDGEEDESRAMSGIKSGDLVLEVKKKVFASKGRNCKGEIIEEEAVELSKDMVPIHVSENFRMEENDESLLYYANVDGYLHEESEHHFEIKDEYVVDALSLKSTGSIAVGKDKNIKIMVKEHPGMTDAVGAGMKIDTSEIKVDGNVANGAEILANKVEIAGQTHQSSKIIAKDVDIHLHKGYAEGDVLKVDILEGGKLVGDIVHIEKLFGGEVEAKEVYIGEVYSNTTISASHHIEVEKILGTGNIFVIDARVQRGYHEKNEALTTEIATLDTEVKKLMKEVKRYRDKIQQEQQGAVEINKKVQELKASGVKPPSSLILKLKDYQARIKTHNSLLKELKDVKIQKSTLEESLSELNASVYDAKVINKSVWKEFNEVQYKLLDPPVEISYLAREGDMIEVLSLGSNNEGAFDIKRQG